MSNRPDEETPPKQELKMESAGAGNTAEKLNDDGHVKYILILGPCGSGKSTFINAVLRVDHPGHRDIARAYDPCTKEFHTCDRFNEYGQTFAFIDSPGFDNKEMCDEEVFVKAMEHLSSRPGGPMKLTGIIYVHSQNDNLGSRTLCRNLKMLSVLIGETYVERVTILVRPSSPGGTIRGKAISASLLDSKSPFYHLYNDAGVQGAVEWIWTFRHWDRMAVQKVLKPYTSLSPMHFYAQINPPESGQLVFQLQKALLGSYAKNCMCSDETNPRAKTDLQEQEKIDKSVVTDQNNEEPNTKEGSPSSQDNPGKEEPTHREEIEDLREQLKKVQADYALLCEQLQVEDNTEQSRVVENLGDINHFIEKIGLSVSRRIHETQSESSFLKSLGEASQLGELLRRFEPSNRPPSLVRSLGGKYMEPEDFFDYAVRAILCQELDEKLFKPFHPSIAGEDDSTSTAKVYNQVRRRESQLIAGRWRRDTFNAMDHLSPINIGEPRMAELHEILANSLDDLLQCCSTPTFGAKISGEEKKQLIKLASMAEELNRLVKGSIIYIGDFQPIMYPCGSVFQDSHMSELRPDPKSNQAGYPGTILATIGLGLVKIEALGEGQDPKETVICTAKVVSERVCSFL